MSKGLEALERVEKQAILTGRYTQDLEIIEKELKQAEENDKLLNVFKNALTIEYHEYPIVEHDHSEDAISCFVKELYTIRQSELEKDMRKALREWVLKNAFPKEIKALEIIKKKNFDLFYLQDSKDLEMYNDACDHYRNLSYLTQEEYDLLKEVLNYGDEN